MNVLFISVVIVALIWVYILFVRERLVARWPATWARIHVVEDKLWRNSRTLLVSRGYAVGGVILALHDLAAAAGIDWTPFTTQATDLLPEQYRQFAPMFFGLFMVVTGMAFTWLRKVTTEPLES